MASSARALIFGALIFLASNLFAQQGTTGSIVGQIRVHGDFPAAQIEVKLESRGSPVATTFADNEGRFNFSDIPINVYYVLINEPEFLPVRSDVVIRPLAPSVFIRIDLIPRPSHKIEPSSSPVSGGNPYLVNFDEYKKNYPKAAVKAFERGLKAEKQGRTEDSVRDFKKATGLAPTFYPARNNLGSAYLKKGNFPAAEEQFQEVIKLQPNDAAARFNLGNVYLLTRRYDDSLKSIQEGLKRDPGSALGHFLLGSLYARTGRLQEAEHALKDALQADPAMANIQLELVNVYLQEKMKPQAISQLKVFLADFPQHSLAPAAQRVLERLQGAPGDTAGTKH